MLDGKECWMKRILLYCLCTASFVGIFSHLPLYARAATPSMGRIRDKVERARAGGKSVRKTNIQELLDNASGVKHRGNDLLSLVHELDLLEWSNQDSFIKTLIEQQQQSKSQALDCLRDQIIIGYTQEKYPLISFCYDLKNEYDVIQQSTTKLFSMISKKGTGDGSEACVIQQGLEKIIKLKSNLELLLNLVNDILL